MIFLWSGLVLQSVGEPDDMLKAWGQPLRCCIREWGQMLNLVAT